jgi:plasmid maintenance system antidote protein VapI
MDKQALNEWMQHSYISRILSGKQEAALDFYVKIARVFDAVPEMLQVAGVLASEKDIGEDVSLWEIVKMVKALDPEERQELERYLDYLSQRRGTEAKRG